MFIQEQNFRGWPVSQTHFAVVHLLWVGSLCGRGPGPVGGAVGSPRSLCTLCERPLGHVHGALVSTLASRVHGAHWVNVDHKRGFFYFFYESPCSKASLGLCHSPSLSVLVHLCSCFYLFYSSLFVCLFLLVSLFLSLFVLISLCVHISFSFLYPLQFFLNISLIAFVS